MSWRDEQFVRAAVARWRGLQVRAQLVQETQDWWMKMTPTRTTIQLSTPISPMDRSLITPPMLKPLKATTCIEPWCKLEEHMDPQSTGN